MHPSSLALRGVDASGLRAGSARRLTRRSIRGMATTNSGDRVVYWVRGSAPSWRALAGLIEKGLPFESKRLDFYKGEHKGPEVLASNPRGQVPTFKDGAVRVNESLAILLYLEKAYPEPALLPKDPADYGKALQRALESSNVQSAFQEVYGPIARGKTEEDKAAWLEKIEAFKKELGYWESYLQKDAFVAGPQFSLADLAVAPFLLRLTNFGASYEGFPKLQAYLATVKARPSLAKTTPPHWAESESPTQYLSGLL